MEICTLSSSLTEISDTGEAMPAILRAKKLTPANNQISCSEKVHFFYTKQIIVEFLFCKLTPLNFYFNITLFHNLSLYYMCFLSTFVFLFTSFHGHTYLHNQFRSAVTVAIQYCNKKGGVFSNKRENGYSNIIGQNEIDPAFY